MHGCIFRSHSTRQWQTHTTAASQLPSLRHHHRAICCNGGLSSAVCWALFKSITPNLTLISTPFPSSVMTWLSWCKLLVLIYLKCSVAPSNDCCCSLLANLWECCLDKEPLSVQEWLVELLWHAWTRVRELHPKAPPWFNTAPLIKAVTLRATPHAFPPFVEIILLNQQWSWGCWEAIITLSLLTNWRIIPQCNVMLRYLLYKQMMLFRLCE